MIRGKERFLTRLYMGVDFIFIQVAFLMAWFIRFNVLKEEDMGAYLPLTSYFTWNIVYSVIYILIAFLVRLYVSKRRMKFASEVSRIFQAHIFSMFALLSVLFTVKTIDISRLYLVLYFVLCVMLSVIYRFAVKQSLRKMRTKGFNKQFVLILGAGSIGKRYMQNLLNHPEYGLEVLGFLDDYQGENNSKIKVLGKLSDLNKILEEKIVDEVVVALPLTAYPKYQQIITTCEKAGIRVSIVPDFYDILPANPHFEQFGDLPIINTRDIPLDEFVNRILKRLFDIVFSLTAIIFTSPVLVIIAIGVKLTSPGPILFKQERVGLNRRTFMMYKFRSMKHMTEAASNTQWTVQNDPRRTKFGTFIRKTSLDELPQFFNVLKGDMSVVGPRPERPYFVDQFKEEIPKYMIKHQVRPGITGWAQVCGLRGDTSIKDRIDHDIYYLENWTLLFDVKIVVKTVINGFINKNAY
ncbi:Undecaprenyl-phosphate glucose phosphotransferase [Lysinibacillus composti]|uniref:Undecaprenyl-phosphate glucose phosphotransferase n=1 Tax=Lysinibacillus composti TaxID=720633 RepID=A0A3N9USK9_9BACI|nr:undecaprenyl-phosphate glucose phosphotransferase [Lysinibacillus composti]MBM7609077.1 Undecaprenyl-phosphate glucose phosphotransferase [Lysinibacillus composti]RQW75502.1 undecaprenyl-phosphate glucose phosphotransferase [Lysinibacillus composti]